MVHSLPYMYTAIGGWIKLVYSYMFISLNRKIYLKTTKKGGNQCIQPKYHEGKTGINNHWIIAKLNLLLDHDRSVTDSIDFIKISLKSDKLWRNIWMRWWDQKLESTCITLRRRVIGNYIESSCFWLEN